MLLLPLSVSCPNCGSKDVTYTCEPKCCFNHLCGSCYTTFELVTTALGKKFHDVQIPAGERDSLAPTTACAVCESLDLFQVDEGQGPGDTLFCSACHTLLKLEFEAVQRS